MIAENVEEFCQLKYLRAFIYISYFQEDTSDHVTKETEVEKAPTFSPLTEPLL